jgi:glutamate 5-kinase
MYTYDKLFGEYNHTVAQILLTGEDIEDIKRRENCENTLRRLLELGALPIINENDTVSTAQIEIGDNDTLSAIVGRSIQADLIVLLTDIDGLFTADPHKDPNGKLIPLVEEITPEIMRLAGGAGSKQGTGGMATKLLAAQIATSAGCNMVIANGQKPQILYKIVDGEAVGTKFVGKKQG